MRDSSRRITADARRLLPTRREVLTGLGGLVLAGGVRTVPSPPAPPAPPPGYGPLAFAADLGGGIDWRRWGDRLWYGRKGDGGDWRADREEAPDLFRPDGEALRLRLRQGTADEMARHRGHGFFSGMLTTDPSLAEDGFATRYGFFEARLKAPTGPGPWPAFWLMPKENLGRDGGVYAEIDIFEMMCVKPHEYWASLHFGQDGVRNRRIELGFRADQGFHDYAVAWEEDWCTFLVDRRAVFRAPTTPDLRQPMYLILSISMGGWDRGNRIDAATVLPAEFAVAWVRVWKRLPA